MIPYSILTVIALLMFFSLYDLFILFFINFLSHFTRRYLIKFVVISIVSIYSPLPWFVAKTFDFTLLVSISIIAIVILFIPLLTEFSIFAFCSFISKHLNEPTLSIMEGKAFTQKVLVLQQEESNCIHGKWSCQSLSCRAMFMWKLLCFCNDCSFSPDPRLNELLNACFQKKRWCLKGRTIFW